MPVVQPGVRRPDGPQPLARLHREPAHRPRIPFCPFGIGRIGPIPNDRTRAVVVVGAGPGGLQAAIAAARAGHQVTVLEREAEPGGQVRLAATVPNRAELGDMIRNQVTECRRLGVTDRVRRRGDRRGRRTRCRPTTSSSPPAPSPSGRGGCADDVTNACDVRDVLTGAAAAERATSC